MPTLHKAQIKPLIELSTLKKLPHAILFTGPTGIGKKQEAVFLAKFILQDEATSPDLHLLTPAGAGYTLDQIRQIQSLVACSPYHGINRVFIIEQAERLGIQPSNAFLKLLEEPPSGNYFILITHAPYKLLPTINSRLYKVSFNRLEADLFHQELAKAKLDLGPFCFMAGGSVGLAKQIVKYKPHLEALAKVLPYPYRNELVAYREVFETLDADKTFDFLEFSPLFEALLLDFYRHRLNLSKYPWPATQELCLSRLASAFKELLTAESAHIKLSHALERFFLKL